MSKRNWLLAGLIASLVLLLVLFFARDTIFREAFPLTNQQVEQLAADCQIDSIFFDGSTGEVRIHLKDGSIKTAVSKIDTLDQPTKKFEDKCGEVPEGHTDP